VRHLLWIDCTAGALAGILVLALSGWLAPLEGLPREVLLFTGAMNLVYASYSCSLVLRRRRPLLLVTLVAANLAWCWYVALAVAYRAVATPFGSHICRRSPVRRRAAGVATGGPVTAADPRPGPPAAKIASGSCGIGLPNSRRRPPPMAGMTDTAFRRLVSGTAGAARCERDGEQRASCAA
jgi:hypothetical protein